MISTGWKPPDHVAAPGRNQFFFFRTFRKGKHLTYANLKDCSENEVYNVISASGLMANIRAVKASLRRPYIARSAMFAR